ncbi:hypothetical protein IU433_15880 [Nocardia puris]|uniref:Uncharacterized protein n=1 Tax=Nocardia puris TaxID=208602 RepID=A0A366DDM8_9NOCA|nr:hypothetical protein [Nocardia puris]MBF6211835.1 hypothetical protein [Nocardia puris]MBF6365838.1 hypothetical protein [Nocardia puris]MBF6460519.1 hypothetical protein [Nocardia puris]RBO87524.1 hypothetical protein DFR74_111231 [Nocardia puris]
MELIPVTPPGVVGPVDEVLRERWERSRRFLRYAFVAIPGAGVVFAAVLTIARGVPGGLEGVRPLVIGGAAHVAMVFAAAPAVGGVLLLRPRSPAAWSALQHPKAWGWFAGGIVMVQGIVADRIASLVGAASGDVWWSGLFLVLLAVVGAAGWSGWRAGHEFLEPMHAALGDTGIAVDIMRESSWDYGVAVVLNSTVVTVHADALTVLRRGGRFGFLPGSNVRFDRVVAVRSGWAPPGSAGNLWTELPVGAADRIPPTTPAVVIRTVDRDIVLTIGNAAFAAELLHRRLLRYAALRRYPGPGSRRPSPPYGPTSK